jgi:opacity protein-like surface antigen
MKKSILAAATLLCLSAPAAFAAGPQEGKFSWSVFGGIDQPLSGDVHGGATAAVPDLGPLNPALAGVSAELRIRSRSHDDIYGSATSYGMEFSYGLNDRSEVFGQIRRTQADEGSVQVGGAFVPALSTTLPVRGTFSDYEALTLEGGYRYYFGELGPARPFVAGRLGATRTDDIRATFVIPDANITIANVPFTEAKWSVSGGVDVGLLFPVSDNVSITAQTGVRYVADLEGDDAAIGGLGLGSINDTGKRVSYPVSVGLRVDF